MIDLIYQFGHIILIACCAALAIAVGLAIMTIAAALHEMNELEKEEMEEKAGSLSGNEEMKEK